MPKEKSVGAVVFRMQKGKPDFLLLHYPAGHWGIPKGHVEKGETEDQTMRREVREETGLTQISIIPGFSHGISYFFKRGSETIFKEVTIFLADARNGTVSLSEEHTEFEWLPIKEAAEKVTFKNTKEALEKANAFLIKRKA